jgi:tetratricopeptide (TPR) repeat protein
MNKCEIHSADYFINKGMDEFFSKAYQQSIDDYSKAIELDKDDPAVYLTRGMAYMELGRIHAALTDFRKAEELGLHVPEDFFGMCLWGINGSAKNESLGT